MQHLITSPISFSSWFNTEVPGAYRSISAEDAHALTKFGLIGKHGFFSRDDLQRVIGLLNYEQWREKQQVNGQKETILDLQKCKLCGEPVTNPADNARGRHKEYCKKCEPLRAKTRFKKWRMKKLIQGLTRNPGLHVVTPSG